MDLGGPKTYGSVSATQPETRDMTFTNIFLVRTGNLSILPESFFFFQIKPFHDLQWQINQGIKIKIG
jgi:hypothetical protein